MDSLPEITTSQMIGARDDVAGEVPFAVVKLANGALFNRDEIYDVIVDKPGMLYMPSETVSLQDLGIHEYSKADQGKVQKVKLKEVVPEYLRSRDGSLRDEQLDGQAEARSQSGLDVNRPTLEAVLDIISMKSDDKETCLQMFKRVQSARPSHQVRSRTSFRSTKGSRRADGPNLIDAMRRQILDHNTFQMTANYDDAQLKKAETEQADERLFEIAGWMTRRENWEVDERNCPVLEAQKARILLASIKRCSCPCLVFSQSA